jgi:uncharacterized protein YciI
VFIILLTYVKPLADVDRLLDEHNAYLDRNYKAGMFVTSGRRVPRTGGVIVARAESAADVEAVVTTDPFVRDGVATYELIEFTPTKWAQGWEELC